jgi:uncharacterized protein YcbK (DUF882 family)
MATSGTTIGRRAVLLGAIAAPFIVRPAEAMGNGRALSMINAHTGEAIKATYWRNGQFDRGAWIEINEFLRDWRTGEIRSIDLNAVDILYRITSRIRHFGPIEVLSGYRSPKTNAMLRAESSGVAKNSYHIKGMAIDFSLPGQKLSSTYRTARSIGAGGVGIYSKSQFIHIDTGPARSWGA